MTAARRRLPGAGWLVLLGGGEFSFGETREVDRAWLERAPEGPVGFLPTASGSPDYAQHFADYLAEEFDRESITLPIYRPRDARRSKNVERVREAAAVYVGGGLGDRLIEVLGGSPVLEALAAKVSGGGVVAAIAAAAQVTGTLSRDLHGASVGGWDWLDGGVVEANFSPDHDRRLRTLVGEAGVRWAWGLPTGSAVFLGADQRLEAVGPIFQLNDADDDLALLPVETESTPG